MSIPTPFRALVDDAAVFPPGDAPLADAVRAHEGYRRAAFADLVGPLVVGTDLLAPLVDLVGHRDEPLRVALVVAASDLPDAVRRVSGSSVAVVALEVRLGPGAPDVEQVRALASRRDELVEDGALDAAALVYVEVPRPAADADATWNALLDAVAHQGFRFKFRTGGVAADAFPSEREVARWVLAARDRRTPFKCTAGLHDAVRHTAEGTGFEHHGYLNVLLAAALAGDGAGVDEVAAVLAERDATVLAQRVAQAPTEVLASAREAFASYGSCSVLEPLHDLVSLGLVPADASTTEVTA